MTLYQILLALAYLSFLSVSAMSHTSPSKKSLTVENNYKYSYVYNPAQGCKPTFLLLHGFPSTSETWNRQIEDLTAAGYGVLVPDLLGYGDTDKPEAVEEYANSKVSAHVSKILNHEGLTQVIGVGHDW